MSKKDAITKALYIVQHSPNFKIQKCDVCHNYGLDEDFHIYHGEMGNKSVCVECDLPFGWLMRWDNNTNQRYFVGPDGFSQWSHPRAGNPLHQPQIDHEPLIVGERS